MRKLLINLSNHAATSAYPGAQTVTECTFNADKNELLVKNIQHEIVAISKMITALKKKKKRLIVTIESTDIYVIDDLGRHMAQKNGKIVLRDNPKLWFRSTSFFQLSGTLVHAKGFYKVDIGSFIADTRFSNGVSFGELNLQRDAGWEKITAKKSTLRDLQVACLYSEKMNIWSGWKLQMWTS